MRKRNPRRATPEEIAEKIPGFGETLAEKLLAALARNAAAPSARRTE